MIRPRTTIQIVHESNRYAVRGRDIYQEVYFRRGGGELRRGLRYVSTIGAAA